MADYLAYWKPSTLDRQLEKGGGEQEHAASNQFGNIQRGDTVWIVSVLDGRLMFLTRIIVGQVTGRDGAAQALGCEPEELWDAEWHILAEDGTALAIINTGIQHIAPQLRFESATGADRLTIRGDGTTNAQQLQTMRRLTPASVHLLAALIS